jgi:hypothetical protein
LNNNNTIQFRNAANNADVQALQVNTSNQVVLGVSTNATAVNASSFSVFIGGSAALTLSSVFQLEAAVPTIQWQFTAASPTIKQVDDSTNNITGDALTIQAQNATGTTTTGGNLVLRPGTGTTANGVVSMPLGVLTLGSVVPTQGAIRIPFDQRIYTQVSSGGSDVLLIGCTNLSGYNGAVVIGNHVNPAVRLFTVNNRTLTFDSSSVLSFAGNAAGGAVINSGVDTATASATGDTLTIHAQNATGTTSTGGTLVLKSGTGTTKDGSVRMSVGSETMIEATDLTATQRITALNLAAALTTTQMPANTGDKVTFIANAATVPTASPVGGYILYVDPSTGNLMGRGKDGTVTTIAIS